MDGRALQASFNQWVVQQNSTTSISDRLHHLQLRCQAVETERLQMVEFMVSLASVELRNNFQSLLEDKVREIGNIRALLASYVPVVAPVDGVPSGLVSSVVPVASSNPIGGGSQAGLPSGLVSSVAPGASSNTIGGGSQAGLPSGLPSGLVPSVAPGASSNIIGGGSHSVSSISPSTPMGELRLQDIKLEAKWFSEGPFQSGNNPRTFRREIKTGVEFLTNFVWSRHGYTLLQKSVHQSMAQHIQKAITARQPCLLLLDEWCLLYKLKNLYDVFIAKLSTLALRSSATTPYDWILSVNNLLEDHEIQLTTHILIKIMKRCDDDIRKRLSDLLVGIPVEVACERPNAWEQFQAELLTVLQQISEPSDVKPVSKGARSVDESITLCAYCQKTGHTENSCRKKVSDLGSSKADRSDKSRSSPPKEPKSTSVTVSTPVSPSSTNPLPMDAGVCWKCGVATDPPHRSRDCTRPKHQFSAAKPYVGSAQEKINVETYATYLAKRTSTGSSKPKSPKHNRVRVATSPEHDDVDTQLDQSYAQHASSSDDEPHVRRIRMFSVVPSLVLDSSAGSFASSATGTPGAQVAPHVGSQAVNPPSSSSAVPLFGASGPSPPSGFGSGLSSAHPLSLTDWLKAPRVSAGIRVSVDASTLPDSAAGPPSALATGTRGAQVSSSDWSQAANFSVTRSVHATLPASAPAIYKDDSSAGEYWKESTSSRPSVVKHAVLLAPTGGLVITASLHPATSSSATMLAVARSAASQELSSIGLRLPTLDGSACMVTNELSVDLSLDGVPRNMFRTSKLLEASYPPLPTAIASASPPSATSADTVSAPTRIPISEIDRTSTVLTADSVVVLQLTLPTTSVPVIQESIPWTRISAFSTAYPLPAIEGQILLVDFTLSPLYADGVMTIGMVQQLRSFALFCDPVFQPSSSVVFNANPMWGVFRVSSADPTRRQFAPGDSVLLKLHHVWHSSPHFRHRLPSPAVAAATHASVGSLAPRLSHMGLFNLNFDMVNPLLVFLHTRQLRALALRHSGLSMPVVPAHGPMVSHPSSAQRKRFRRASARRTGDSTTATAVFSSYMVQPFRQVDFNPQFEIPPHTASFLFPHPVSPHPAPVPAPAQSASGESSSESDTDTSASPSSKRRRSPSPSSASD